MKNIMRLCAVLIALPALAFSQQIDLDGPANSLGGPGLGTENTSPNFHPKGASYFSKGSHLPSAAGGSSSSSSSSGGSSSSGSSSSGSSSGGSSSGGSSSGGSSSGGSSSGGSSSGGGSSGGPIGSSWTPEGSGISTIDAEWTKWQESIAAAATYCTQKWNDLKSHATPRANTGAPTQAQLTAAEDAMRAAGVGSFGPDTEQQMLSCGGTAADVVNVCVDACNHFKDTSYEPTRPGGKPTFDDGCALATWRNHNWLTPMYGAAFCGGYDMPYECV
jgi:cellulose 1,4-beta-cellobiosidase